MTSLNFLNRALVALPLILLTIFNLKMRTLLKLNKVILFKFKDSFYNKTVNLLLIKYLERSSWSYNITFLLKLFCEFKVSLLFNCYKGY